MLRLFLIFLTFISFFLVPTTGFSGVLVEDMLVLKGEKTMLSAETRGRFFTEGGRLVEFFVDGKSLGKSLSGGDGFAYKQFIPVKTGLFQIAVASGDDDNTGLLLSLKKGAKVIFIDVEGSLFEGILSQKPKHRCQEVIKGLSRKFPVVFLQTGPLSIKVLKTWLKENGFVGLPVLSWGEGEIFDEISKKGLKIKAVIGRHSVIASAQEYKPQSFSFEEAEDAVVVKNWVEIGEMLLKGTGKKPSH
jgi:hypothetical protein